MSNLEGKLSQSGTAVVYTQANPYLGSLNSELQKSIGQSLVLLGGYVSKFEIIDELRLILTSDEANIAPDDIKPLLDATKSMTEIAVVEEDFNKLEVYINELAKNKKGVFDPPLGDSFNVQELSVYPIPQSSDLDPRRFGRLFMFESFAIDVRKWLINNAILYGFTLYEDYGLYYIGFNEVKSQATSNVAIQNLINKFQQTAIPTGEILVTATQIQAAKDPVSGDLEVAILSAPVSTNSGQVVNELYLVPGGTQTALKDTAQAALIMTAAAKADGVTLSVGSGFRPAAGPTVRWTTASGKTNTLTTQEAIRRSESRFVTTSSDYKRFINNNGTATGTWGEKVGKEAFIWYASSEAYNAATAPPGSSNHGSGIALDFNTGTRNRSTGFSQLNESVYKWLARNAHKYGFVRAVSSEEWHWEYRPTEAVNGPYVRVKPGNGKLVNNGWYADLGLDKLTA